MPKYKYTVKFINTDFLDNFVIRFLSGKVSACDLGDAEGKALNDAKDFVVDGSECKVVKIEEMENDLR